MRWLIVSVLIALPAYADEPEQDTITIPRSMLKSLTDEYIKQRTANVLLLEQQEATNKRLDSFHAGTGCT